MNENKFEQHSGEEGWKDIAKLLKEKGIKDLESLQQNPEVLQLFNAWWTNRENELKISEPINVQTLLNVELGRLYFAAEIFDEALESFEAARMQANQENQNEILKKIEIEMDELGLPND